MLLRYADSPRRSDALLLVFAWTGVVSNLPAVATPVLHSFGGANTPTEAAQPCTAQLPDWARVLQQSRPSMAAALGIRPATVRALSSYDCGTCRWSYRVRSTLDIDHIGSTQITWSTAAPASYDFQSPVGTTRTDAAVT